jgi:two-component system, chemotaxis family, CheB/CheR fusion protein
MNQTVNGTSKQTVSQKKSLMTTEKLPDSPTSPTPPDAVQPFVVAAGADVTASSAENFPIVGIGASAGGLAAFEAFFAGMPTDVEPNMAFVLVQHLAPDHKSMLAELIRRFTRMEVFEVEDGMRVRVNCAYIIPPNHDMAFINGTLQLLEPTEPRGQRLPIDFFFRSLAQDQHQRAIGIILSGTGSDGTLGVRAIKNESGMVMAQTPETTEFDGMPSSAIASGMVDYELPPANMATRLISYVAHAFGKLPRLAGNANAVPKTEAALKKIFVLLRAQTGHDFSKYKPNTINRRIERRMAVHHIDVLDSYVKFLQQTPTEVEELFRDFLIGVTNFFRDPEAFQVLEHQVIPQLFAAKPVGGVVRVWSAGCSTGEEAYSLAILLQEHMESLKQYYTIQVFATDIDSRAITAARAGLYSANIAVDMSPERLSRFFTREAGSNFYRVRKNIRELVIFSEQDLIKDPPFSRIDLIACRNLMIYLDAELQKKIIPLFHYALNPGGRLFLGTSEGIGDFGDLFSVIDLRAKLYLRKEDFHAQQRLAFNRFTLPTTPPVTPPFGGTKKAMTTKMPLREVTEQALLQQLAPAGALVNGQGDILYVHGRTGMYLEPSPGESGINNIVKMAREGLRQPLQAALRQVAATKESVQIRGLRVKTNGHFTLVNVSVRLVTSAPATTESPLYLIVLEEFLTVDAVTLADPAGTASTATVSGVTPVDGTQVNATVVDVDARIVALKQELRAKDEYLQSTHEELESSNEELKSANEEMQSVNEELQSTNEELETSKEELQSVNEELATVNIELHAKVSDLSRANNDMNNLLAGTGIATVFVDQRLRILRFTPTAAQLINLIPSDVGRPVGHIVSNLVNYPSLVTDAQAVLDTLAFKEIEVQTSADRWFSMCIRPYRTLENVIEGVVITFVDITEVYRLKEGLKKANNLLRLAIVVRDAHDAITVQDLEGRIIAWNPGAVRMYGWSEVEALALNVRDRIPLPLRQDALAKVHELSLAEILQPYRTQRLTKSGVAVEVWMTATALKNVSGQMYAIATTERAFDPTMESKDKGKPS